MAEGRVASATTPGAISGVAHELRTPIAAVRGAASALRREGLDEGTRDRLLAVIEDAVGELSRLVDDLLDAGRLDAGALAVEPGPVDVVEAARGVVEAAVAATGAAIELIPPAGEPPVARADAGRLRQAVANLVDNAVRYSPPGSPVEVRVERTVDGVRIAVADSGPGIPTADRDRIFEPFVRLSSGTAGSGLGLYLARELARAMGGELRLAASGNGGSTFAIDLPAAGASG
jgi:two-component system sensor histidine kinase KdpD